VYNEDQEEVHQILKEFRKILDEYGDRIGIGEIWYKLPRWVKYFGEKGDGLHLPFNFRLLELSWDAVAFRNSVDELDAAVPSFGWPNYVLGNHDRRRLASRIGVSQARVAAMLLLTLRGTPTIYYGDELGLENGIITADIMQDPQGLNLGLDKTRDQERTPMQWSSQAHAGFSTVEPWLPVSPDFEERNVAVQNDDPASILNLYRQLLKYRRNTPALEGGIYRSLDVDHEDCFVYLREHPEGSRLIALNFTDQPRTLSVPHGDHGEIALSTYMDRTEKVSLAELTLRPHEGIIVEVG
jgi:alpha-glucosidase